MDGDGWLPDIWDPYSADFLYGCLICAQSNDKPGPGGVKQHLTWGILNSTLEGLFNIACVQGYSQEMNFEVMDSKWGIVGKGYIIARHVPGALEGSSRSTNGNLTATS